jgi:glycogen operon protein
VALRGRQQRNFLATLLLSQGVPMLCGGDEIGRTQRGNNNAYCQDNELSWHDWELDDAKLALLEFTRRQIRVRRDHLSLRRTSYFSGGRLSSDPKLRDIVWLRPDGAEMTGTDWSVSAQHYLGALLPAAGLQELDEHGAALYDDTLLVLLNAGTRPVTHVLPELRPASSWEYLVDTSSVATSAAGALLFGVGSVAVSGRSLLVLRQVDEEVSAVETTMAREEVP